MSERETETTTDGSASTAEFRAFANRPGTETERPWKMRASGVKVTSLAVAVLVIAVVLAIIGFSIAG